MKLFNAICFTFILVLFGCETSKVDENLAISKSRTPFNVTFDMTTNDVKALYPDCDFRAAAANTYGFCGGGEAGFEVVRNDTVLFFYWENWQSDKVGGILLLDPSQSYKDVFVGMKLSEYLAKNPTTKTGINLISSKEDFYFDNDNSWANLETDEDNYAAEYNFDHGEAEFIRYIDTDKKIESIFVKNPN